MILYLHPNTAIMSKIRFLDKFLKKGANYYVTVVNTASDRFSSIFSDALNLSDTQLIANLETIPDLFLITDYIASKVSSIPIKVVNKKGEPANNSELHQLIYEPNQYQSWQ